MPRRPTCWMCGVEYQNLQDRPYLLGIDQTPGYTLYWGPGITPEAQTAYWGNTLVWRTSAGNERMDASDLENRSIPRVEWVAEKTAYFAVALKPEFENAIGRIAGESLKNHRIGVAVPSAVLEPGQTVTSDFRLYAGPSHLEHLEAAWPTLPSIQRFFDWDWLNWFAVLLLNILNFFYGFIPNYGVAIILLTVLVRVAVFPLTLKQMKSMKRMQALAPEMEALKKKYGEDQQELSRKMMELYRERGVSPLGGCLPLFVQMPVFIALWRMLAMAFEIRGADFVGWIDDLSSPDRLFHLPWLAHVPIVGQYVEYINLLPILVMGAMVLSMRLMPTPGAAMQNPQQKMIMNLMPIIFGLFCYTQPSGLCLYLLVSTLLGVVQQQVTQHIHMDVTSGPPPKKTPRKRRHWYAAAQEKKRRQLKQETKQGTKR
jgi:YidC/Oxa1 family membrane protein insertase